jgi:polysaccharide biosynthesis protein PslH
VSPELIAAVAEAAEAPGRGRVIADGPVIAAALLGLARRRPLIYSGHDLESAFRAEVEGRGWRAIERFERKVLQTFTESWMVSPPDVAGARRLAPGAEVRYVPPVVDVSRIRPVETKGRQRILYLASFRWEPNREGLRFMIHEVLPRLWDELPDARLTVVGPGLEEPPSDDPRVDAPGFVDDLAAAYGEADCVVVPLHSGGGAPLKFIEALAYGMPIVATPRAGRSLEITAGEHYLEAEDGPGFAAAIARVLRGEAPGLGAAARALAEQTYSIESVARRLAPDVPIAA